MNSSDASITPPNDPQSMLLPVLIAIVITSTIFLLSVVMFIAVKRRRSQESRAMRKSMGRDIESSYEKETMNEFLPASMRTLDYSGLPVEDSKIAAIEYPMLEKVSKNQL